MSSHTPFDRNLRRLRRDRAATSFIDADYLYRRMAEELLDRLDVVKREFSNALVLGCPDRFLQGGLKNRGILTVASDPGSLFARRNGQLRCDEDFLPAADEAFDLVLSIGTLDSVNDLPGALALIRRALRPDGLFLASFAGAGTLPRLRSAMLAADAVAGVAAPRIHPQIDVRAAGDLLSRAGFALPVVDVDMVKIRFPHLMGLVRDLRAMGSTNILVTRSELPLGKLALAAAMSDFSAHADVDGKTAEIFNILYLTAWSPAPNQPKPAARGSGTMSLTEALRSNS
jgi:NADH dehydrogenase [ubiquinone] 1 alpha subcomplex assembly factor 5